MTWHEGKSEGFREILRYNKRNRNAICGLWRSTGCWKPIHIIKNLQQNTLSKTFFFFSINFWYVVKMGSCVRANSIIYKENFEINAPCPWSFDVVTVECLNVITVLNVITFGPKFNEVLSVLTFGPKCNKPPMRLFNFASALLLEWTSILRC